MNSEKHWTGGGSGAETRHGNETIAIVLTMSVCHFIVYNPFPILWTMRASLGYLFSVDLYNFIAGTHVDLSIVCTRILDNSIKEYRMYCILLKS